MNETKIDKWLWNTHMNDDESLVGCPVCAHPFYSHFSKYTHLLHSGQRLQYDAAPCYQEVLIKRNNWKACGCLYLKDCIGEEH